jgi:Mg2+ and Co2+ transporter CorA
VLTSVATILLVLTAVTGFFGQNWKFIPYDSEPLFFTSLVVMVVLAAGTALYFRRKGWL